MLDEPHDVLEPARLEVTRATLRVAATRDQARTFEHLQVFRDRRQAHVEGLSELLHRRVAAREPRENRAPRRIGEGPEDGIQRRRYCDPWRRYSPRTA